MRATRRQPRSGQQLACVAGERTAGIDGSCSDASDEAPAEERPAAACVAGERNDGS